MQHGLFSYETYLERLIARGDLDVLSAAQAEVCVRLSPLPFAARFRTRVLTVVAGVTGVTGSAQTSLASVDAQAHLAYLRSFAAPVGSGDLAANLRRTLLTTQPLAVQEVRPPAGDKKAAASCPACAHNGDGVGGWLAG